MKRDTIEPSPESTQKSPDRQEAHERAERIAERLLKSSAIVQEWKDFGAGFTIGQYNPQIRDAMMKHPDIALYERMRQIVAETQER